MIVIDRMESGRAVLDVGGERVEIPTSALPPGVSEGDVLRLTPDPPATQHRRQAAQARLDRLASRDHLPDEIEL